MKLFALVPTFFVVLLASSPAFACAVCFDANDETRGAFLGTTIFLSLFPLAMMGGFAFWLWKRARALASEENQPSAG